MTVETVDKEEFDLESLYEEVIDGSGRPRSVHTSVDAKITYNPEEDSFGVAVTETNAFPEAQEYCESIHEEEWIQNTVDALTGALPEDAEDVIVNLPEHAFDGDHDWLKSEKTTITEGIESEIGDVETTVGAANLEISGDQVLHDGTAYDFVLNLSDVADNLNEALVEPDGNTNVVNAPTGIWNTGHPETGKSGLHDSAAQVTDHLGLQNVYIPENYSVQDFEDSVQASQRFFEQGDSAVLKGDFGTHGDEVVYLDREEFENLQQNYRMSISDYVKHKVKEVEGRVSRKKTSDSDYSIFTENGLFDGRGESSSAVVEQAVEGETELNGDHVEVLDYKGRPLDLVFTVWDTGGEYRVGATVRASEKDDTINANCGSQNFDLVPYDQAFEQGIYQSSGPDLQELLEGLSGRDADRDELMDYSGPVAATALGARNLSAYKAER